MAKSLVATIVVVSALFGVIASSSPTWAAARQVALVIGASAYGENADARRQDGYVVPPFLANAVSDARLVTSALEDAGFDVSFVQNPSRSDLRRAVNRFAEEVRGLGSEDTAVLYYAGHGAQGVAAGERDVDNYLIPIGADLVDEFDLDGEAVALSVISHRLSRASEASLVLILDACRDFPLPRGGRQGAAHRGLAEANAAAGTFVAYSTQPGKVADDGPPGRNGPYALALAKQLRIGDRQRLEDIFISVRNEVMETSRFDQIPWENGSLRRAVYVGQAPSRPTPPQSADDASSTAEAIASATPSSAAPTPWRPSTADYRAAQTDLKRLGHYLAGIDGDWGPGSRRAMTAFQREAGLPQTGELTKAALARLRSAPTPQPKATEPAPKPEASVAVAPRVQPSSKEEDGSFLSSLFKSSGGGKTRSIMKYDNGGVYEGEFKNGKQHGVGTFRLPDGYEYTGEWFEGRIEGRGVAKYANGSEYEGRFRDGAPHGIGKIRYADGGEYEGEWTEGVINGEGIARYANGIVYEGGFKNSAHHGRGSQRSPNGYSYTGAWVEGLQQGDGVAEYPDGAVYEGQFRKGVRDGAGTIRFQDGFEFTGAWKDGQIHGEGKAVYANGDVYQGDFCDGKRHGSGTMQYATGGVYRGYWVRGDQASKEEYEPQRC